MEQIIEKDKLFFIEHDDYNDKDEQINIEYMTCAKCSIYVRLNNAGLCETCLTNNNKKGDWL